MGSNGAMCSRCFPSSTNVTTPRPSTSRDGTLNMPPTFRKRLPSWLVSAPSANRRGIFGHQTCCALVARLTRASGLRNDYLPPGTATARRYSSTYESSTLQTESLCDRPSSASRHQQSHVRNCLMEMGIVCHDAERDCYRIAAQHLDLYIVAQDSGSKRAPATVAAVQRNRETLGTAAEEAIVCYERKTSGQQVGGSCPARRPP